MELIGTKAELKKISRNLETGSCTGLFR